MAVDEQYAQALRENERYREALREIALAGMSGTGQEGEEAMRAFHARQAWKFIQIAARALMPDSTAGVTGARPLGTMRAEFNLWALHQGCDTDGAWSAWQAAWKLCSTAGVPVADEQKREQK